MAASPASRRFHFCLRALFVVMTILGVLLGWLGVQLKWIHDRHEALRWIADYRARQLAAESGSMLPLVRGEYVSNSGSKAPWSLRIFGEKGVERFEVEQDWVNPDTGYSVSELRSLFPKSEVKAVASRPWRAAGKERIDDSRRAAPNSPLNLTRERRSASSPMRCFAEGRCNDCSAAHTLSILLSSGRRSS
jgi:hypothetical protein